MRVLTFAVLLLSAGARAETAQEVERAKNHFEAGRALFQLGEYQRAAREFEAGNQIAPRPRFLLNMGHCYRKLGQREKAVDAFRSFLSQASPADPDRPVASKFLEELERELKPPPVPEPPPPKPIVVTPPPVIVQPAPAPVV